MKAWRCTICGYVHRGDEPPELCPVCGAPASDFEALVEKPAPKAVSPAKKWRCLVCGYEHEGTEPPDLCPLCGATRDSFEPVAAEPTRARTEEGTALRIVILGGGIAGLSAAESARKASPNAVVTLVSQEEELPYYRINLTRLLAGEVDESALTIHPAEWYVDNRIELVRGAEATAVRAADRSVTLKDGRKLDFDRLILASGAHPFLPPFMTAKIGGLMTLRTVSDARELLGAAKPGVRCVCIGGGILGLETAAGLAKRGAKVTVLESHGYLMPRQLSRRAGEILGAHVEGLGIRLVRDARTKEILGQDRVTGVLLEGGRTIDADLIVVTTGVRSNTHLAREIGLEVNLGVVVDNHLKTSNPDILAAGDAAEHNGVLYGSWHAGQYQGSIAGLNAVGSATEFGGIPRAHTLKVLGMDMTSVGQFEPVDGSYRIVEGESDGSYQRFVFRDSQIVGGILMGDTRHASALSKAVEKKKDYSDLLAGSPTAQAVAEKLG
jgi:nitrite reductase (NADH) large subunit